MIIGGGAAILIIAIVAGASITRGGDKQTVTPSETISTPSSSPYSATSDSEVATTALPSAAGKPCVAVADPLPAGAPEVPVPEGPPPTSLVTQDLKDGTGATVAATDSVTVNYIGVSCSTGKIFDSSYKTGQPATFPLNGVIPGWSQGLVGMKVGGKRLLGIPSGLAYGADGSPPDIAPNEALWFVVEMKSVS
jgi:peptidylprolyl isomerase